MLGFDACCELRIAKESKSRVDLPPDGLLLQICRIQMPLSCVILMIMQLIHDNNTQDYAACRTGHTEARLGGLAAVVKDSRAEGRSGIRFAFTGLWWISILGHRAGSRLSSTHGPPR
jgi:hypothetical protein